MSRICELTKKKPISGNNVSHAINKTKRKFLPNLHTKKFFIPEENRWIKLKVSSHALRIINRDGIYNVLKRFKKNGKI